MLPFKRRDGTKIGTGELGREEAVKSPCKHTNQGENTGSQSKIKQRQKDGLRVTCSDSDEVTLATGLMRRDKATPGVYPVPCTLQTLFLITSPEG